MSETRMRAGTDPLSELGSSPLPLPVADSNTDASVELLRTMSEVLDIRSVFPRVSAITRHVLPHDALALVFVDAANNLRLEARSVDDVPRFTRLVLDGDDELDGD